MGDHIDGRDLLPGWEPALTGLVDVLVAGGHLHSAPWIRAFRATPRHLFVPRIMLSAAQGYRRVSGDDPADRDEWLSLAYSDAPLTVRAGPHAAGYRLPGGQAVYVPTSSSTMPSLMARMLEVLDVRDGHRVLEIGTGTGYNAALLCHRLGHDQVTSIDIAPDLVDQARDRLAQLGYHPALVAGDGAAGAPAHGSFDRIIATAAVPEVPPAWIHQLAPGGMILANLRGEIAGNCLCLLTKHDDDDEVIGPFLPLGGDFMWLRPDPDDPHRPHEHQPDPGSPARTRAAYRSTTRVDPTRLDVDAIGYRFLLQFELRGVRSLHHGTAFDPATRAHLPAVVATAADGSRAEAFTTPEPDGGYRLLQSGPRRIWDTIDATQRLFDDLARPGPDRFGVVANDSTQFVWFGDDDSWYRWPLPLV